MSLPLIGITASRINNSKGFPSMMVMEAYIRAIAQAGAAPVVIPLGISKEDLQAIVSHLDGVLFTGGGDIRPQVYGSQDHSKVNAIDDDRDRIELDLFHLLSDSSKPYLGICRGIQMINVAMGGTIYEDILDQCPGALNHDRSHYSRGYLAHPVDVTDDSRLRQILGASQVEVNSLHHQGLRQLAPGVRATAFAQDGLVEAIEVPGHAFGLAVQWHPEWLQEYQPMRELFQAFVQAADHP
jgi:putative glutamine amidotransferase